MVRDGVANLVSRLGERGCRPRKVGHDAWESCCPAHRGLDHTLSITRNELNHVVLECRSAANCTHWSVIRSVGFTNDDLYAETPDWLIERLRRTAVERSDTGQFTSEPADFGELGNTPTSPFNHETSRAAPLAPEIVIESSGAVATRESETSRAVAPASETSAVETVKESPTDALMRMAGLERVILGSDGRSYALVSVNGKAECRELKSKGLRNLLTHAALRAAGKLPTPEAIAAVVGVLEANAEFDGSHEDVFLRVGFGPSGSSYFLDLADRDGRIIEIRPDGWELAAEPGVLFRHAAGQLALPLPAHGGSLELLKKYVNVE